MKIILVGSSGTIGKAVQQRLQQRHQVIAVGLNHGDYQVDISSVASIRQLYQQIGRFDAVVSVTGKVHFAPLTEFTAEQFAIGLTNKLMGQVNLVMEALPFIQDKGSFTLTSGILSHDPIVQGSSAAMVNGAIDSFVRSAAIELPKGLRINSVSPTVIEESLPVYADYFPGFPAIAAEQAALGYIKSVDGQQTGQVYRQGW